MYSMYFCLSPVARHNSIFTSAMCLPLQQVNASLGDGLVERLDDGKIGVVAPLGAAAPPLLDEPLAGWLTP